MNKTRKYVAALILWTVLAMRAGFAVKAAIPEINSDKIEFQGLAMKIPFIVRDDHDVDDMDLMGSAEHVYRDKHLNANFLQNYREIRIALLEHFTEEDYQQAKKEYESLPDRYSIRKFIEMKTPRDYFDRNNMGHKCIIAYFDAGPALYGCILYEPKKQVGYNIRFHDLTLEEIITVMQTVRFVD